VEIRTLRPDEHDAAIALWRETQLVTPPNDPRADLEFALAGESSTILAGAVGSELVATAMIGHDGHRGWVYYLAVRPDRRRRGHGARMLRAAEAWLRDRGVPKLNLMVRESNSAVLAFYARLGYVDSHVRVLGRRLD
jgi:ribosomal protein S18 acetylase RimI-like enzyme